METLTPPVSNGGVIDAFLTAYNTFVSSLSGHEDYPVYAERPIRDGRDFTEVARALGGDPAVGVRKFQDSGRLLVSAAVPVRRYKQVLGALLLTKDDREIDEAVHKVQLAVLQAAGVAFGVTILLSIYLAGAIARPIHRLVARPHPPFPWPKQNIPDANRADESAIVPRLEDMTEALTEMDAIESFTADVSHEIKNPRPAFDSRSKHDPHSRPGAAGADRHRLEDVRRLDHLSAIFPTPRAGRIVPREDGTVRRHADVRMLMDALDRGRRKRLEFNVGRGSGDPLSSRPWGDGSRRSSETWFPTPYPFRRRAAR